jgi:hypothetical protein
MQFINLQAFETAYPGDWKNADQILVRRNADSQFRI